MIQTYGIIQFIVLASFIICKIPHYLPLLNHKDCTEVFNTYNPLLFWGLLPPQLLATGGASKDKGGESPAALRAWDWLELGRGEGGVLLAAGLASA